MQLKHSPGSAPLESDYLLHHGLTEEILGLDFGALESKLCILQANLFCLSVRLSQVADFTCWLKQRWVPGWYQVIPELWGHRWYREDGARFPLKDTRQFAQVEKKGHSNGGHNFFSPQQGVKVETSRGAFQPIFLL